MATYQRKDHFYRRARREGYRSRAAYKLLEIQKRERVLRPGQRVVDLGCWPGSWLQVAAEIAGASGRVAGLDLAPLEPGIIHTNVFALEGDLADSTARAALLAWLGGPADVLLCDAAPKLTGVKATDRAREEALLEAVELAIPELLQARGDLLVKVLEAPEARRVAVRLRAAFASSKWIRPTSSRRGTREQYLLGRGYAGASQENTVA